MEKLLQRLRHFILLINEWNNQNFFVYLLFVEAEEIWNRDLLLQFVKM